MTEFSGPTESPVPTFPTPPTLPGPPPAMDWSAPSYAPLTSSGYPQPVPPPRGLAGLGTCTQLLLTAQLLATVGLLFPVLHQRRLIYRAGDQPGSVSGSAARSADHLVAAFSDAVAVLFVLTGLVWLVWFYRARLNVTAWAPTHQRHRPTWAVWSWLCPVVSLWYPYLIARDVVDDSERPSGPVRAARPARRLLLVWWIGYALLQVLWVVEQAWPRSGSVAALGAHADLQIALVLVRIAGAALAIVVVRRLTSAQTDHIANPASSAGSLLTA